MFGVEAGSEVADNGLVNLRRGTIGLVLAGVVASLSACGGAAVPANRLTPQPPGFSVVQVKQVFASHGVRLVSLGTDPDGTVQLRAATSSRVRVLVSPTGDRNGYMVGCSSGGSYYLSRGNVELEVTGRQPAAVAAMTRLIGRLPSADLRMSGCASPS